MHSEGVSAHEGTQDAVYSAVELLARFIASHEPNVTVKNQPKMPTSMDVPQIANVVKSLAELIVATRENKTDNTVLEQKLDNVAKELRSLPRDIKFPDIPKPLDTVSIDNQIDYTAKFDELANAFSSKDFSPEIKVAATKVTVDNSEVAKVVKTIKDDIVSAISGIEMPTYPSFDLKPVVEAVRASTKAIEDRPIVKPPSSVDSIPYTPNIDDYSTANYIYVGQADPGSLESDPVWRIKRLNTSSGLQGSWADGDALFNNVWDDRTTLTYS